MSFDIRNKYFLLIFIVVTILNYSCTNSGEKNPDVTITSIDGSRYFDEKDMQWKRLNASETSRDSLINQVLELNIQGSDYRDKGEYKIALTNHFQALRLAEEINDTIGIINALNNLGTDLRRTASNTEASEYHYRALELANTNPSYLKSRAIAMNGLGNIFLSLKKGDEAKEYFEKSLIIEKKLNSNLGQAINYANLGDVMKMKGALDEALKYYNLSLVENYKIHSDIGIAICKRSIGTVYLAKKNTEHALKLIRESVQILEHSEDVFHKLEMQVSLCESLIKLKKFEEAEQLLQQIFQTTKVVNSYENKNTAYELLNLLRKEQNDYKRALEAKELAISFRDSTLIQNNEVRILEIENRYKNKQSIQQIDYLIKEKALVEKTNLNQKRIFILLFLLLTSISAFTYYMYSVRKRRSMELKHLNDMKSRFFGNVSHEFRTPLTLIKGPLEKLLNSNLPSEIKTDVEMMHRNSNRLLNLVEQVLCLSKIDAGKFQIAAQNAVLSDEVKGISQSFKYLSKEKKIKYDITIENSKKVWFDVEIVEIILTNLLSNAFKFASDKGTISIIGKNLNQKYEIKIANTVKELKNNDLNRFFDRFYSGTSSHHQGTGIGLSLVKELCNLYRADLSVKKTDENIVEFTVVLPVEKEHFKPWELATEESANDSVNGNSKNELNSSDDFRLHSKLNPIMLIVEDNEDMRNYISGIFKSEYQILEALDGEMGLKLAKQYIPDIIISDIMMPKMNGIEMCNLIKHDAQTNHIPVILLSALTEEENILKGLENSADDYLTKPFGIKILKSKVKNLIQIRKTLVDKYREEMVIKPINLLLKDSGNNFSNILKDVLENHLTNPDFSVESFCELANMSRTQLHRKLTATTGMSVTEFIRVHRVKIASELLKNPDYNVSDVCYASGFNNNSYFTKQFKLVFGMTPKDFRENLPHN